jgi:hypothetical protein
MHGLLDSLRSANLRLFLPDALHLKGQALFDLGRMDEASEALEEARLVAESIGSRRMRWQIQAGLSKVEAMRGDAERAEELRKQAAAAITYIAAHTPSAELRGSFLSQPQVKAVLDPPAS